MAAAVTSGAAALLLQAHPQLSPDDVKCRLMASARPAVDPATDLLGYSVFQQGAGMVHAWDAGGAPGTARANGGPHVGAVVAGTPHSGGTERINGYVEF